MVNNADSVDVRQLCLKLKPMLGSKMDSRPVQTARFVSSARAKIEDIGVKAISNPGNNRNHQNRQADSNLSYRKRRSDALRQTLCGLRVKSIV